MKTRTIQYLNVTAGVLLCAVATVSASTPWLHTDGNQIKDPVGNTVVLRGIDMIDIGFMSDWQGGTAEMLDRLTDKLDAQGSSPGWYPKVIRINVTPADTSSGWPHRFNANYDHFYYGYLRPIVDYCKAKDVYAIIDWHYVANTYDHITSTSEFWTYMAPKFSNDSHVLFELFNEPMNDFNNDWIFNDNDVNEWLSVRQDMQTWVNIVRQSAPKNLILVAGTNYAQILKPIVDYPIDGDNIVYVSHIYPGHFHNWFWSDSFPVFGRSYKNEIETVAAVYPVIMTEWGFSQSNASNPDDLGFGTITDYGQPLMDFIEELGVSNSAWVASYDWGPPIFWNPGGWPPPIGPWPLRIGEGEMGGFVKDNLYAKRNDDQPCDTTTTAIEVSPLSHNFGKVKLGKSKTFTVSISNKGCGPLVINSVGLKTDFYITSFSSPLATIQPGDNLNLNIKYKPTELGDNSAVLAIKSSDANKATVEVTLIAEGISTVLTPSEQIANILTFFDKAVSDGTLQWAKPAKGKKPFSEIMRDMIESAADSINQGKYSQACKQLEKIRNCFYFDNKPPERISGPAMVQMVDMLTTLMQTLNCKP